MNFTDKRLGQIENKLKSLEQHQLDFSDSNSRKFSEVIEHIGELKKRIELIENEPKGLGTLIGDMSKMMERIAKLEGIFAGIHSNRV